MNSVVDFTNEKYVVELDVDDKFQAIESLAQVFHGTDVCDNVELLVRALIDREEIMSTGIGFGIAIPHAKIGSVKKMAFAVGISKKGIDFDSMDGQLVHLVILVAAGEKQHKEYLRLMSNIMSILKVKGVKESLIESANASEIIEILASHSNEMH